jgi:hypothetical protein
MSATSCRQKGPAFRTGHAAVRPPWIVRPRGAWPHRAEVARDRRARGPAVPAPGQPVPACATPQAAARAPPYAGSPGPGAPPAIAATRPRPCASPASAAAEDFPGRSSRRLRLAQRSAAPPGAPASRVGLRSSVQRVVTWGSLVLGFTVPCPRKSVARYCRLGDECPYSKV